MNLDPRKALILAMVVEEYIRSAQPVGSKTVVKRGIKSSSATVRQEMGELAALGFLEQPHPSAGRIPTDLGFRCYVDGLADQFHLQPADKDALDQLGQNPELDLEERISRTARFLSDLSRQVGVVMVLPVERDRLKAIYVTESGPGRLRVIFHFQLGTIEEKTIVNEWLLDLISIQKLNNLVNRICPGKTLFELRRELIRQMEEARTQVKVLLARAVELSVRLMDATRPEVFVTGAANLFDQPEPCDVREVKELVRALEEKSLLIEMLERASLMAGTKVIIGAENWFKVMQRFSVVASTYGRTEATAGSLGVIGPTRMDYSRIIPMVQYASELVSCALERMN